MAEHLDLTIGSKKKVREELQLNYSLYNGFGNNISQELYEWCKKEVRILDNTFDIGYDKIQHHDIISEPLKILVGEQLKRPLNPMVIDTSESAFNTYKKNYANGVVSYFKQKYVDPMRKNITTQYLQENGIRDQASLTVEQQQQMRADVENRLQSELPNDFQRHMQTEIRSPSSIQLSKLMEVYIKDQKVKSKFDECFRHMIISGVQAMYQGIENNQPVARVCDSLQLDYDDTDDVNCIEDGYYARYVEELSLPEIVSRHSIRKSQIDAIKDLILMGNPGRGSNDVWDEAAYGTFIARVSRDEMNGLKFDMRSRRGQEELTNLLGRHYDPNMFKMYIRHAHFVWKALRELLYVRRLMPDGTIEGFWRDETYTRSPADVEIRHILVPEVYQATKLGYGSKVMWLDKGPVPFQVFDPNNPFKCSLPYIGVRYNKFNNNTPYTAPLDILKNDQYKYNVEMANLHLMEATDLGKVFVTSPDSIPDNMDPKIFYMNMKYSKMAVVNARDESGAFNPALQYLNNAVDLSNTDKIQAQLAYLAHIEDRASRRVGVTPARRGQSGQHTPVAVNNQNLMQSTEITMELFNMHDNFMEACLNYGIRIALNHAKESTIKKLQVFDDYSIGALEIDKHSIINTNPHVHIVTSAADHAKMDMIKNMLIPLSSQNMELPDLISLLDSDNMSEIRSFVEKMQMDIQQRQQAASESNKEQMKFENELKIRLAEAEGQIKKVLQQNDNLAKLMIAQIGSERFAKQWDIDRNKINDNLERALIEIESKEKLEKMKIKSAEAMNREKMEVERLKIRNSTRSQ